MNSASKPSTCVCGPPGARAALWWGVAILAFSAVLRLYKLGTEDFRLDEAWNLLMTEHLFDVVFRGAMLDTHAPLFPVLVTAWRALGLCATEWSARLLPVLLSLGTIALAYLMALEWWGLRAAIVTGLLLAAAPFQILHAQELKDGALLAFAAALTTYLLDRAVRRNAWPLWLAYSLTAALTGYSQFFAGPLLIALNVWGLMRVWGQRDRLVRWSVSNLLAVALLLPLAGFTLARSRAHLTETTLWWVPKATLTSLGFFFKTLAFGYSASQPYFHIAAVLYLLLFAAGTVIALRRDWRNGLLPILWFAGPIAMAYAISQVGASVFLYRAMLAYTIPFYMLVALAVTAIRPRLLQSTVIAVLACLAAIPTIEYRQGVLPPVEMPHRPGIHPALPVKEAAQYIQERVQPGDVIVHSSHNVLAPFYWYGLRNVPHANVTLDWQSVRDFRAMFTEVPVPAELKHAWMTRLEPIVAEKKRVWFVFSAWEREWLHGNAMDVYRWMDAHYVEAAHQNFGDLDIFLYEKPDASPFGPVVRRDRDDGATALVYREGAPAPYRKEIPDAGLFPTPLDERRGSLTLRFSSEPAANTVMLTRANAQRRITVAVDNRADAPVACRIEALASTALINLASLDEEGAPSDTWRLEPFGDRGTAVLQTRCATAGTHTLTGRTHMEAGAYVPLLYCLGNPSRPYLPGTRIAFTLDGHSLFGTGALAGQGDSETAAGDTGTNQAPENPETGPEAWRWLRGNPISITTAGDMTVALAAETPEDGRKTAFVCAYLAFEPLESGGLLEGPVEITVPPHSTAAWGFLVAEDAARLDVWAHEIGPVPRTYAIFDVLPEQDPEAK